MPDPLSENTTIVTLTSRGNAIVEVARALYWHDTGHEAPTDQEATDNWGVRSQVAVETMQRLGWARGDIEVTDNLVAALCSALVQAGWTPKDRADLLRKNAHPTIRRALEMALKGEV